MIAYYNQLTCRTRIVRGDWSCFEYVPFATKYHQPHRFISLTRPVVDAIDNIRNYAVARSKKMNRAKTSIHYYACQVGLFLSKYVNPFLP